MKKSKKEELYRRLQKLADMANDICVELHDMANMYYEESKIHNVLKSLAIDADELSLSLTGNGMLPETTTCMIHGNVVEIGIGNRVGFVNVDGTVDEGFIADIFPVNHPSDMTLHISKEKGGNPSYARHISRIMPLSLQRHFCSRGWNKIVENLASQKKVVSLWLQDGTFDITVIDESSKAVFQKCGLYLKDLNTNLINEMKGVTPD